MEFLKALFNGRTLSYDELLTALEAYNGDEANKDKQIKLGNLASGEYVSKDKLDRIQETLTGKEAELTSANDLIAQLKKDSKGNEEALGKINAYEQQVAQLQEELKQTKIQSAVKVALLSEKAVDVDYLTFKLTETLKKDGQELELDEAENIKGWNEKLAVLKNQCPNMFESGDGGGYQPLDKKGLPKDFTDKTITKEQFQKMTVDERIALKQKDENLYRTLKG